jgi:hypothetical protein
MPKIFPCDLDRCDSEKAIYNRLNEIRQKYIFALNLLLSDRLEELIIPIAWLLFIIHGLLDENNFSLLNNNSIALDDLPWHSDKMENIKTWIPEALLCITTQKSKRQILIMKLKSYLNHFYNATLKSGVFDVTIDWKSPSGITLISKFNNFNITEIFCSTRYPTILAACDNSLYNKLNYLSNLQLVTFQIEDNQFFIMLGPASLAYDVRSCKHYELLCFKDAYKSDIRIAYKFERVIKYFLEDVFHGFDKHPVNTFTHYYTMGSPPRVTSMDARVFVGDTMNVRVFEDEPPSNSLFYFGNNTTIAKTKSKRSFIETISSEQCLGCLLAEMDNTERFRKSEKITFNFSVQCPKYNCKPSPITCGKRKRVDEVDDEDSDDNINNY